MVSVRLFWSSIQKIRNSTLEGMIHIRRPCKFSNFQDPSSPISIYVQCSSTPLTLDVYFKRTPSSNDNQSIKRKENPRMTIICYQVFPSDRLTFWVSTCLDFLWLFFIWNFTICFLVALYSNACSCRKISRNVFYL